MKNREYFDHHARERGVRAIKPGKIAETWVTFFGDFRVWFNERISVVREWWGVQ